MSSSSTSLILNHLSLPSPTTTSTLLLPFKTPLLSLPSKPFFPLLSLSLKIKKQTQTLVPLVAQTSDWAQQGEENTVVTDEEEEGIATAGLSEGEGDGDGIGGEEEVEEGYVEPPEDAKLFVGNLPFDVDSQRLAELFVKAGAVEVAEV